MPPEISCLQSAEELVEKLLCARSLQAQKAILAANSALISEATAETIKTASSEKLRSNVKLARRLAELITYGGTLTGNEAVRALGLLSEANVLAIGLGRYQRAIDRSQRSAAIYAHLDRPQDQARARMPQVDALARVGQYREALALGQELCQILAQHKAWRLLAITVMNMGAIYSRQGNDVRALSCFDQAAEVYALLGPAGRNYQSWVEQNRAISLRNLGRFEEAIAASVAAQEILTAAGQRVEAARAQQNLGMTYYVLGRFNEALVNLDQVYAVFAGDHRWRDAMLVELFVSECLLQLRRYREVIEKCGRVRRLFNDLGVRSVAAQAVVNEAIAYTQLGRFAEALASLEEARTVFALEGNQVWVAMSDLETSAVLQKQGQAERSEALAVTVADTLSAANMWIEAAEALVVAAAAALDQQARDRAEHYARKILATGSERNIPALCFHGNRIMAAVAERRQDLASALAALGAAISELEKLRGRMMVEYRAEFTEDKQTVYEDAVRLCIATQQPRTALDFTERAKSRSLLELVAYRLDLRIQARRSEDHGIVSQLAALRKRRNYLYRRWESGDELKLRGWNASVGPDVAVQQEILTIEQQITMLWHQLLVRNADYARDAALWSVHTEPAAAHLPAGTAIIEYFTIRDRFVIFLITSDEVTVHELPAQTGRLQQELQLLLLNMNMTPRAGAERLPQLTANVQSVLKRLYDALLAPIVQQLAAQRSLIFVPHGLLHYLPLHALYDGERYVMEQWEISYLPGSSLLRHCLEAQAASAGALIYANTMDGRLPNTRWEAQEIGTLLGTRVYLNDELDPEALAAEMERCRIIHLATHGDFRADNPLFSGLYVGGGWLTTLDIFNLRIRASLVTLSACQTGRNVVRGGDELFGLMRALLAAGAASIVLSLWPVEDRSTAELMASLYRHLATGRTKGGALRQAQLDRLHGGAGGTHPYYWAPFFLVGSPAAL